MWYICNRHHKPVKGKTLHVKAMGTVSSGPIDGTCKGVAPPEKNASGIAPLTTFATNKPMHGQLPVSVDYYQVSNFKLYYSGYCTNNRALPQSSRALPVVGTNLEANEYA